MTRLLTTVAAFALAAACNPADEGQPGAANGDDVTASGAVAGNADAGAPGAASTTAGMAAGQQLTVVRQAECVEVGPDASDEPWEVKQGSTVNFVKSEGGTSLVDTGSGVPCRIASDALAAK